MASIYYPSGCSAVPAHFCNPCGAVELARVRGAGFVHKDTIIADPTALADWQTAILAGTAFVIPETNGSFDGGKNNEGPGYGDVPTVYTSSEFSVKIKDPLFSTNYSFWEAMKRNRNYKFFFRSESKLYMADKVCIVLPMAPIADDLNSRVEWEVEIKWTSENFPTITDIPTGLFDCYAVSA